MIIDKEHIKLRESFYKKYRNTFWDTMFDKEYALYDSFELTDKEMNKIKEAAKAVYDITSKACEFLRNATDDELIEDLGIPKNSVYSIRMKPLSVDSIISRVDLCKVGNTYKAFEINSDTPTFIKECFYINSLINKELNKIDINQLELNKLKKALNQAISESCSFIKVNPSEANIVFTSHSEEESKEDYFTTLFLMDLCDHKNVKFVSLDKLNINNDFVLDDENNKIDVLYRQTYPIESLILDKNNFGDLIGLKLLDLMVSKKVALINPISAFLMQSKAVQAFIWESAIDDIGIFNENEIKLIFEHFLPTFWDKDPFINSSSEYYGKYVSKPSFGREGNTINIYNKEGEIDHCEKNRNYEESLKIYQKFIPLENKEIITVEGVKNAYLLYGVFIINGMPSSIGIRASETQITNNLSYFLPVSNKN